MHKMIFQPYIYTVHSYIEAYYIVYCHKAEVVVVLAFNSPSVRFVIRLSRDAELRDLPIVLLFVTKLFGCCTGTEVRIERNKTT